MPTSTSYPGHFASGQRKWSWHRPVTWPQNLQYLGCSIMIIYAYKYVYRIIIYIVITDRSKQTKRCVYNQRESNKIILYKSCYEQIYSYHNLYLYITLYVSWNKQCVNNACGKCMLNRSKYSSIQKVQILNLDQIVLWCIVFP